MKRLMLLSLAALTTLLPSFAGTLDLNPLNGQVAGQADTTVGWGFTINGDLTDWLVVTAVQLGGDPFPVGTAANFTDLLSVWVGNNSYAIAPGASLTQGYAGGLGLAEFAIPGSNNPGDTSGVIMLKLEYDLYDADPFVDGAANYVGSHEASAAAQIDVIAASTAPEPGSWVLMAAALPLIAIGRRGRMRRR